MMKARFFSTVLTAGAALAMLAASAAPPIMAASTAQGTNPPEAKLSKNVSVFASGLNNPRGLKFGPDGMLYVAEGGTGGDTGTPASDCTQVPPPIGPYTGSPNGSRISRIGKDGKVKTVAQNLPSSQTSKNSGGLTSGVADIAFIGNVLYALINGAGCSHGLKGTSNAIIKVNKDGSTTQVVDLSAYYMAHPTKTNNPGDFEPDGTPYSMIQVKDALYVVEPNHGSLEKIMPNGQITRVLDISESQGHSVPTVIAYHDDFYIGNLLVFPVPVGAAGILQISPDGKIKHRTPGLTTVLGVAFDKKGQLYALETTTVNNQPPVPGTGKVVRVKSDSGELEEVATGLTFPTGMTFGPDGMLYVSNYGFGFPPGKGEIVRIKVQ